MARFLQSDDDSDMNSTSAEESDNSESEEEVKDTTAQKFIDESSDSEEEKRIVRTEKDKRYAEMMSTINNLKNYMKINDWSKISPAFDLLRSNLDKVLKFGMPRFYLKMCLEIADRCKEQKKAKDAKMSTLNAKALNAMNQKVKKWEEHFKTYITDYKNNPIQSDEDDTKDDKAKSKSKPKPAKKPEKSSDKESESDDDESSDDGKKKTVSEKKKESDEDDEDEDSEEWDEDDDEEEEIEIENNKDMFKRSFWVKSETKAPEKTLSKDAKKKDKKKVDKKKETTLIEEKKKKEGKEVPVRGEDGKVYTMEKIWNELQELQAMRGRRATNRQQVVADVKHLATKATNPLILLKVKITLVTALYDLNLNSTNYQPVETWKEVVITLMEMVAVLNAHDNLRLSEDEEVKEAFEEDTHFNYANTADKDTLKKITTEKDKEVQMQAKFADIEANGGYIHGNLFSYVRRCCDEFKTSLQEIDPHQPEYVDRLRDEKMLLELVTKTQEYYQKSGKIAFQCHTALLRLELMHYYYVPESDQLGPQKRKDAPADLVLIQLAMFLYKHGEDFEKTRALLCHVYYLALHNRFEEARDLLLMSHVQDTINDADISTRIHFNRTMAQLGLSAFRLGYFDQSLDSLAELYHSNRVKELLAQGIISKFNERDHEKEAIERRRQYPFHMHINLDVLESVHLLSAMFVEVPNTAMNGQDNKRKVISKHFRRQLDYYQGKAFNGPPENTKECVMAATTKLQRGDWKKAMEHVKRLKMWNLINQSDVVFAGVHQKIKEVALRTYLLTYGPYYVSLSLASLCEMFELGEQEAYRLCSKMMVSEKLQGAWDQPSRCIFVYSGATNHLQKASLQFAEKAEMFLQQNEKLLEQKIGYSFQNGGHRNWGESYMSYNSYRKGFQRSNYDLGRN